MPGIRIIRPLLQPVPALSWVQKAMGRDGPADDSANDPGARMSPLARKYMRLLLLAAGLGFLAVLLGILPISAGFLKGPVEEMVRDAAGLELSIAGPLKVRLGPTPTVRSGGLSLGAPGAGPLVQVDSLHGSIGLLALLRGQIRVREFSAAGIRMDYCAPLHDFPDKTEEEVSELPSIAVDGIALTGISIRCGPVSIYFADGTLRHAHQRTVALAARSLPAR